MRTIAIMLTACGVCVYLVSGCLSPPTSGYVPAKEAGVMTVMLDDHDYDLAAESIAKEMMERGLPKGFVVALGPVDTRDCKYDVQIRTLQKKLQVIFSKQGDLKFMAAVDAMSGSDAAQEIYKLIEFNWFKNNPADKEELQKFGKLASVNGILFGRVSNLGPLALPGGGHEVSYTFVWELANTSTGISELSHEYKIRKNVR